MSRSRKDGRRHGAHRWTKEYNGNRPSKSGNGNHRGWPICGRDTKRATHQAERREARREIRVQAEE